MIEVNNLSGYRINDKFLKAVARKALRGEKKKITELSIAIVGEKKIRELNKRYRKKDKATDVLSFQYDASGEIVICPQQVAKNAKAFNFPFKKELARVLTHGIWHILGYHHKEMANLQNNG